MRSAKQQITAREAQRLPDEQLPLFDLEAPKPPANTYPATLYRLHNVSPTIEGLHDALNTEYLNDHEFSVEERSVGGAPALLVHGTLPRERADWCDVLTTLTGQEVSLSYVSCGGALFVAVDDQVYALTYGTLGRWMVNPKRIDQTFGISFAVRTLAPDQIKQVRRRAVGTAGRIDRNVVPGGQHIRLFGIDKWGEIVGQVGGRTDNPYLTDCRRTGKSTPIESSDSLRIRLCVEPEGLLADLREINRVCQRESPLADLEFITQIRPVPDSDPRVSELVERLDELLGQSNPTGIGLAIPGDAVADIERIQSYRIRIPKSGQRPTRPTELTLNDILNHTRKIPTGERWNALCNGKIFRCEDDRGEAEIGSNAASRWITAQLSHGSSQLLLHEGSWYEIGDKHRELLHKEIEQILAQPASVVLPPWPVSLKEEDYNKRAAKAGNGLVLLDRHLLKTAQHHHGIEACDLLGPDGELIHIKRADRSSPLSHLFAQGVVAVDALKYDVNAREALVKQVHAQQPNHRIKSDFQPEKVIYGIMLGNDKKLSAKTLFTFAQIALYQAVKTLRAEGVMVEVIDIPTV